MFTLKTSSVFQSLSVVQVPGPENCTSPSYCWSDGNDTYTLKNVTNTFNIAKCETQSYDVTQQWERPGRVSGNSEARSGNTSRTNMSVNCPQREIHVFTRSWKGPQVKIYAPGGAAEACRQFQTDWYSRTCTRQNDHNHTHVIQTITSTHTHTDPPHSFR